MASKTIVLINKTAGHRSCPIPTGETKEQVPVTENFRVTPGVNRPKSRELYDLACENKRFKKWVDAGDIYELTGDITNWPDDLLVAMINRTSDIEGLKLMVKRTKSPKHKKRLETAIEAFEVMYREAKGPKKAS